MAYIIKARRCAQTLPSVPADGQQAITLEPLTVRIPDAVRMTGIGRSKLYELIQSGDIAIVKIGASTLIPIESLRQLIDRHRRG
tara:strand:+ start:7992 stop:8243 length:252 start_codon:yes stop_codon:yes gene_type:complete